MDEIAAWCGGTVVISLKTLRPAIDVQTRLGLERVEYGDYILKDPRGDFSVMSEKAFLGSYERLDGTSER